MFVKIDWVMNLPASPEKLFEIATDYENYINYLPQQIKKITIIEVKENETTTEETLTFMTILKKEITTRQETQENGSTIKDRHGGC